LDALHIAHTLKFAATIGVRAQSMSADELHSKGRALDQLLQQTESEMHELQVLLRRHLVDIVARVERDLNVQVQESVPVVRQRLKLFQSQHPKETGRAFGVLLEGFLMEQIETVFRSWRVREDQAVQAQLDVLSARFVTRVNTILERLQQTAGSLFEIPAERVSVSCPLRVESHLYYRVERVFHSLDSFLLALPRFLLRPFVLRKMRARIWQLLDTNAGRIRFDYVERLQSTVAQFEKDLTAAVTLVTESLRSALREPGHKAEWKTEVLTKLEAVISTCSKLVL
jgi:hypothetical protein